MKNGLIVVGATLASLALTIPAAYAGTVVVEDGADATGSPHDIVAMKVKHKQDRLVVRTTHTDLRKHSDGGGSGTTIYIDSNKSRKGPELALTSGLESGTDYALVKVKKWKLTDRRVDCDYRFRINWAKDFTKLRLDRACFKSASTVRVSQKMVDSWDGSHPVTDWAPGKRAFSPWVVSD